MKLTKIQEFVVEYRARGWSQAMIARQLHTTRQNICLVEKAAWRKKEQAEQVIDFFQKLTNNS